MSACTGMWSTEPGESALNALVPCRAVPVASRELADFSLPSGPSRHSWRRWRTPGGPRLVVCAVVSFIVALPGGDDNGRRVETTVGAVRAQQKVGRSPRKSPVRIRRLSAMVRCGAQVSAMSSTVISVLMAYVAASMVSPAPSATACTRRALPDRRRRRSHARRCPPRCRQVQGVGPEPPAGGVSSRCAARATRRSRPGFKARSPRRTTHSLPLPTAASVPTSCGHASPPGEPQHSDTQRGLHAGGRRGTGRHCSREDLSDPAPGAAAACRFASAEQAEASGAAALRTPCSTYVA
jgi:hypothetical protein